MENKAKRSKSKPKYSISVPTDLQDDFDKKLKFMVAELKINQSQLFRLFVLNSKVKDGKVVFEY